MNSKSSFERYNIILIILLFVIPILALDTSCYFLLKLNYEFLLKEQEKKANNEVETLASESDFSKEFAMHFHNYFNLIKNAVNDPKISDKDYFTNYLEQNAGKIFKSPFPEYNLYVFKVSQGNQNPDLIYYNGNVKKGKSALCKAFSILFSVNNKKIPIKEAQNNKFLKTLIGDYSSVDVIANEMIGLPTHTNGYHNCSWFIWDYFYDEQKNVYGSFLICDDIYDYAEKGRLLALQRLKARGFATGAFIPFYKDFGKANYLSPLEKSDTFKDWANELTIKNEKDYFKWIKEPLPQAKTLGKYTAYCFLDRGASHIAVILVKSLKGFAWPKWVIVINLLAFFILLLILYLGIVFGRWPQISLISRFTFSYLLASVVPFGLLCVTANGYILLSQNSSADQAASELMISLKKLDAAKLDVVKKYRATFSKAIVNPEFIQLIKDKGIEDKSVGNKIVEIFEKPETGMPLPLLGVKIFDENGNGVFVPGNITGKYSSNINVDGIIDTFRQTIINLLRKELGLEVIRTKEAENDLANRAYLSITGNPFDYDLNRLFGIPVYRKNGDYCSYFIFDLIKIDGIKKYMLFLVWDDKAFDDGIIKDFLNSNSLNNNKQNFLAYRIKGQKVEYIGEKTRHVSQKFIGMAPDLAIKYSYRNKTVSFDDEEYTIAVMPSLNFSQTIFIGWIDKFDITKDIYDRRVLFIRIILFALVILLICSVRSSSIFLRPISALKEALSEVSNGNLNVGFKDCTKDELGQLSNELSNMISELKEKERLSKLISDQAVQALQKKSGEMLNDTETFKGVALVSDIRNFTGMSEEYDPVMITELLNEHFAEMAKIISDNGGLIYKFIGDAIEAVFSEKDEYDESASERAFKAGCMMIAKLSVINSRRKKKNLFSYRIGVGLCYGTLFSGTVGSLETRLDYSILGDPLKNAAKFEALSIQNPSFPLVLGEDIAEKIAKRGISFEKIDNKGNGFSVYTLKEIASNIEIGDSLKSNELKQSENKTSNDKVYSISNIFLYSERIKSFVVNSLIVFFVSFLITIGVNAVYYTRFNDLKSYSDIECSRLENQLKCDDSLRSVFDALCFEFFEDIYKILNSDDNNLSFGNKIKKVAEKYEKLNIPMPKYYCCQYENEKKINEISFNGFSDDTAKFIGELALEVMINNDGEKKTRVLMGGSARFFNMKSVHYRRSALATVENENTLIGTDRIYDKDHKKILAYVFCGMPQNMDKEKLINYYTLLAGKNILLAFKNNNEWYFSSSFPQKEKSFLQKTLDKNAIQKKGYYCNEFELNNKTYEFYAITKELAANNYSINILNTIVFLASLIILSVLIGLVRKRIYIFSPFIANKLRIDIAISAILPLLTVCFLSYLFVNEDLNVKKTETISKLNKFIDDTERKELYYSTLCESYLKNLPNTDEIKKYIKEINNSKNEEQKKIINDFSDYLLNNVAGYNSIIHKSLEKNKYFYFIKEIIFMGKDGWLSSAVDPDTVSRGTIKQGLSDFGKVIARVGKDVFLKNESDDKAYIKEGAGKANAQAVKNEMVTETLIKTLESVFGSDYCYKIISFPNNFITMGVSYSIVGFYASGYPNILKPNYLILSLVLFDARFVSDICNMRNDIVPYKQHIASGSIGEEFYCFYSANVRVGDCFFLNSENPFDNNTREDLKTVKELGLASSWLNTSFVPVSRIVDLYGPHFLEARQGNYVKDGVYAAIASEIPLINKADNILRRLGLIILFAMFLIFFITQSIINDLIAPVKRLIEGAVAASSGIYNFRTNFKRGDELGALCDSFDKMMKALEEKQLMNRMVSKTALKVTSNLADNVSRKVNAVLMYVSVPDFDLIMHKTTPYELFSKLKKQISVISKIVMDNDGDIDKIMGEKMLIAFHIGDKKTEDVAVLACKVAHEIESSDEICFKVSVGLNYGQVISGFLGVGEKRDFTVIGDPVNVAARIAVYGEKLEKDKCLISETVYYYTSNKIKAELYGQVELKGKSQPMKVYQLS